VGNSWVAAAQGGWASLLLQALQTLRCWLGKELKIGGGEGANLACEFLSHKGKVSNDA